jgi:predicted kinase
MSGIAVQVKTLYLIRGLPGSGKSTLASLIAPDAAFEADDFFIDKNDEYRFDPQQLKEAHEDCQSRVEEAMFRAAFDEKYRVLAVANTFSKKWEAQPYLKLARHYKFSVCVIECQNNFGSVHGVPDDKIEAMRNRWENIND